MELYMLAGMSHEYVIPMDKPLHDTPACHSLQGNTHTHNQEGCEDNVINAC